MTGSMQAGGHRQPEVDAGQLRYMTCPMPTRASCVASDSSRSVVTRNEIYRDRVYITLIDRRPSKGHHPLIAHLGVGELRGAGDHRLGQGERSGLLGTPDLLLSFYIRTRHRAAGLVGGAARFLCGPPYPISPGRSARDPRARPPRSNPTARASRHAATMSRRPKPSARSASPSA